MKTNDENKKFDQAYNNLKEREGGYTTGKKQKKDEPTNMGIKQSTLDKYSAKYPDKNFPHDVKDLKDYQAKEIYKNEYWYNTKIPQIENDRIRNAVFAVCQTITERTCSAAIAEQVLVIPCKTGQFRPLKSAAQRQFRGELSERAAQQVPLFQSGRSQTA